MSAAESHIITAFTKLSYFHLKSEWNTIKGAYKALTDAYRIAEENNKKYAPKTRRKKTISDIYRTHFSLYCTLEVV